MSVSMHEDKREKRLSIMNQQKTVCDGQRDGFECEHFLCLTQKVDTPAAIALKKGETSRWCTLTQWKAEPLDLGDAGKDMAVECNRYQPSQRRFDAERAGDNYDPLTKEQVAEVREGEDPGKDEHFPPPEMPPEPVTAAPLEPPPLSDEDPDDDGSD